MVQRTVLLQKKAFDMKVLMKPWTMQLIVSLREGSMTFSELKWKLDMSSKTLSLRLKELASMGLIEKSICADAKVRIEYSLTAKGHELSTILSDFSNWQLKWD